ncbi:YqjF family protein [Lederbergia wuyishanensis]|uniref:Uncharacterized protein YqjF (DUF2071 family) n=1 Tax=Lederbergia wuyishanensis TaxID=1347903 RepID=A0ABU0D5N7_9BACI|nr:DUF2071 domain-containing protein [Lederbergia wuyishanensis]MCJ8008320.1 DUF2071 domain-containing protein [Lederbergia wuyishanensis]MDQ0343732.1 uncharacterized protein YqjF (DUF2071 family) [Lederbergia wuyishanensis]
MDVMKETGHRPYPLPSKYWLMRQRWSDVLFMHLPIQPEKLQPYIPSPIEIDIFDGTAWLGVIVFNISGIYPRGFHNVSIRPAFPEINLRTYVKCNNKPGIYFLSLDVDDWTSYTLAKKWLHVPYYPAKISFQKNRQSFHFESVRNRESPIICKGSYTPKSEIFFPKKMTLDHWLTERYCFFSQDQRSNMYCLDIHHQPWPLQKADAVVHTNDLFNPFHFDITNESPIFHYSQGLDALIWNIKKM